MKVATAKVGLFEIRDEWLTRPLDEEHIAVLVGVLNDGGTLPPLAVVKLESGALAVVDGNHRFAAYRAAGHKEVPYRIVDRGEAKITWWLAAANRDHGKNRTDAEKRDAVRRALAAPEGADQSVAGIARHCGVSVHLVRAVREEMAGAPSATAERKQRARAAAQSPDATPAKVAAAAGVDRKTARKVIREARAGGGEIVHDERSPHPEPRPEPPVTDEAPLPVDAEAPPEWQGVASACDRVAAAIVRLKRECSSELRTIPGGQEILDLLTRAHGIATRRKPERCPVANCAGAGCPVCGGKGYTLGPVKGADRIVAAAEVARG